MQTQPFAIEFSFAWFCRRWQFVQPPGPCMTARPQLETNIWGFPKIMGTFLGVPIIRTIVFWGLYCGPLILGNYYMVVSLAGETPR